MSVARVALLILVACQGAPEPTCTQVADHMLAITKGGDRAAAISGCEDRRLSKQARLCLLAAKSVADLADCQRGSAR
jgi:hypothetical protein